MWTRAGGGGAIMGMSLAGRAWESGLLTSRTLRDAAGLEEGPASNDNVLELLELTFGDGDSLPPAAAATWPYGVMLQLLFSNAASKPARVFCCMVF